jgi:hypothetical protein
MKGEMALFTPDVLAADVLEFGNVVVGSLAKRRMGLSPTGEMQPLCPSITSRPLNELLSLGPSDTLALLADHAMDTLSIDHDVDGESDIRVGKAFSGDAVLRYSLAEAKASDCWTVETRESERHLASCG